MNDETPKQTEGGWKVSLRKHRATWHYFTTNPQGGGFGSNYCGPKHAALRLATRSIPKGTPYILETESNGSVRVEGAVSE